MQETPTPLTSQQMVENWENFQEREAEKRPQILKNAIRTPDGTIICSRHRHDYVTYEDTSNGLEYMVDGGLDYLRRNVHKGDPYEEMTVTDEAPFEVQREAFAWGSYGKNQDKPLHWIELRNMTDDHIKAILTLELGAKFVRDLMKNEQKYRKKNGIVIEDTE